MGDVLEHMSREDGFELIKKLKTKCRELVIVTPAKVGHQGAVYGNDKETHVSQWHPIDFEDCSVIEIQNSMVITWEKPEVYFCEGMRYYGERMMTRYGLKPYTAVEDKVVLFMGLYFEQDYEVFRKHTGRKYVYWNGSDVSRLLSKEQWQEALKEHPAKHICHTEELQKELESVGVEALVRPLFFADVNDYKVSFKPKDTLEVYVNCNKGREDEYGVPIVYQASKRLPEVKFFVYGTEGTDTENLQYIERLPEKEADERMKNHHVFLRLNHHDGLSQMVIKAGLWGQYVVSRQGTKGTIPFEDMLDLVEKTRTLQGVAEPQKELREYLLGLRLDKIDWLTM
jgi:bifunctional DNA-binding transcriptional regulator/antitoxin component of YhaV-PrlF toxin-antitoxin module